ncbi:MAG: hypothetical protein KC910_23180, partial [Candidatus Eremiobacteraeota bacterium]|nr:hypothetical protein [Candidatus Eremiobacteraeota bacterium]
QAPDDLVLSIGDVPVGRCRRSEVLGAREGWKRVRFVIQDIATDQLAGAVATVNQGRQEEARYRTAFDVLYEESPIYELETRPARFVRWDERRDRREAPGKK